MSVTRMRFAIMKTYSFFIMIFIILLTACAPQNVATLSSTPISTNTPLATTTPQPEPTQTLEPTPMSIPVTEISLDSCTKIVETKISDTGIFEVVFESHNKSATDKIISEFGSPDGGLDVNLVLWSEDTQKAVPFPLPLDALGPKISSDHRHIIFRRDSGENQSEIWVTSIDGKGDKKFGTVRLDEELKARYPNGFFSLDYGWIPNTDKFFYEVDAFIGTDEYTPAIIDKFVLVDANSGKAIPVAIPSDTQTFSFAPDGSQMAILTKSGLRVLNTQDGKTQFTIQAPLNEPAYSPDGKYIIDFIDGGILRIDAKDGQQRIIPLKYTIMSSRTEGPSYGPLPDFRWIDNSTFILSSLDSDKRYVFAFTNPDPNWTFTVWQVDLASGTTRPIRTFNGPPYGASFSPDMKRLAFLKYQGVLPAQTRDLILADLATGEILETIAGGEFNGWFPDSNRYLYTTGNPYPPPGKGDLGPSEGVKAFAYVAPRRSVTVAFQANTQVTDRLRAKALTVIKHYLGQIGKEPVLVDSIPLGFGYWVDKNRIVVNCKIMRIP